MKKIGLDLRLFGTEHGGIGRYCQELFPRILSLDKQNKYFVFFNPNSLQLKIFQDLQKLSNVEFVPTSIRHYSVGEQLSFLRLLNKYNLDLVHFPNFNVPLFYKRPFVVTIHDMVHHKIGGAKKSHFAHFWAYKKVISSAANNSKNIITVSEASKKDIVKLLGVSPDKIKVTYEASSLNTNIDDQVINKVKRNYFLSRPYLFFVGVWERKKNLVNLARGFDYCLQKYKLNMDLVIAGKPDKHYPEIKHHMLDIKYRDHLVLASPGDDEELSALYSGAYAFVSASLHEGFGLPGVEALSFGLPLLVSNIPTFNEIYDNAAVYFNPLDPSDIGEKINFLVRDSGFYKQMQENSFNRSQLFDWKKTAEQTLEIYRKS